MYLYFHAVEIDLVSIFERLERNKLLLGITDYSVTQASLEQIFIQIAKTYSEEDSSNEHFNSQHHI